MTSMRATYEELYAAAVAGRVSWAVFFDFESLWCAARAATWGSREMAESARRAALKAQTIRTEEQGRYAVAASYRVAIHA